MNARSAQALAAALPFVSLSHEVNPETREFERTATTVLNASVMPIAARYLDRLQREVKGARLHVMHSAGGMASPEAAARRPLAMALSGPAAGVSAAAHVAASLGPRQGLELRHGRHDDRCLPDHRRRSGDLHRFQARRPAGAPAHGRRRIDRRRRRLAGDLRHRRPVDRPGERGRRARPRRLWPRRHAAHRDRRQRRAGLSRSDAPAGRRHHPRCRRGGSGAVAARPAPRRQRRRTGAGRAAGRQCHDGAGAGASHRRARRRRTPVHACWPSAAPAPCTPPASPASSASARSSCRAFRPASPRWAASWPT